MAVPKRKTSKSKKGMRRGSHSKPMSTAQNCSQCGAPQLAHRVCGSCGYYAGRQVVTIDADD